MADKTFIGEAGGFPGLVRITFDSIGRPVRVEIDDLIFKQTDKELISDLFVAALNDGFAKIDAEFKKQFVENLSNYYKQYRLAQPDAAKSLGSDSSLDFDITKYFKGYPDGNGGNTQN